MVKGSGRDSFKSRSDEFNVLQKISNAIGAHSPELVESLLIDKHMKNN